MNTKQQQPASNSPMKDILTSSERACKRAWDVLDITSDRFLTSGLATIPWQLISRVSCLTRAETWCGVQADGSEALPVTAQYYAPVTAQYYAHQCHNLDSTLQWYHTCSVKGWCSSRQHSCGIQCYCGRSDGHREFFCSDQARSRTCIIWWIVARVSE